MLTAVQRAGVFRGVASSVAGMPRLLNSAGPAIVVLGRCTVRGMAQYPPVRVVAAACGGGVRSDVCSK
jgi:hypothetical protein